MSIHSEEKQKEIMRRIKDLIALDPLMSGLKIQNYLFTQGYKTHHGTPLDYHFIQKMIKKVRQEAVSKVNNAKLAEDFAEVKETNRLVRERLIKIAFYTKDMYEMGIQPPSAVEQMSALMYVAKLKASEVNAAVDLGFYVKELKSTKESLPAEQAKKIDSVLVKWGLLPEEEVGKPLKDKNAKKEAKKHYKQKELDKRRQRARIEAPSNTRGSGDHQGSNEDKTGESED